MDWPNNINLLHTTKLVFPPVIKSRNLGSVEGNFDPILGVPIFCHTAMQTQPPCCIQFIWKPISSLQMVASFWGAKKQQINQETNLCGETVAYRQAKSRTCLGVRVVVPKCSHLARAQSWMPVHYSVHRQMQCQQRPRYFTTDLGSANCQLASSLSLLSTNHSSYLGCSIGNPSSVHYLTNPACVVLSH